MSRNKNDMNKKITVRIVVDLLMTAALIVLMSYALSGEKLHEWIGTGTFILFILHHVLNRAWLKNLFRGKYTLSRIMKTVVDILIFIAMLGLMYSAVIISRHIFRSLPIQGGKMFARQLHMLCSYWGMILISIHIGMHWEMVIGIVKKRFSKKSKARCILSRITAITVAIFGIYSFGKHKIDTYLFLKTHFAFFDFNSPLYLFLLEYAAIMGLFAIIGYYLMRIVKKLNHHK